MNGCSEIRSICFKHGVRIYPVVWRGQYVLEMELNRNSRFDPKNIRKLIRGETLYPIKGNAWYEALVEKYKNFYEKRIKPKLEKTGSCDPSRIQPIYSKCNGQNK